jgi:hypothetical protein
MCFRSWNRLDTHEHPKQKTTAPNTLNEQQYSRQSKMDCPQKDSPCIAHGLLVLNALVALLDSESGEL